jgi:hypothetical protein
MTRFLNWWLSRPCEFKWALAGILSPYALLGITYLVVAWFSP